MTLASAFVVLPLIAPLLLAQSSTNVARIEDITSQLPRDTIVSLASSEKWTVMLTEQALYYCPAGSPQCAQPPRIISVSELPQGHKLVARWTTLPISPLPTKLILGEKSLYFSSLCQGSVSIEIYPPCAAWKFDNYQILKKIVAVGDTIQASIPSFFAGVRSVTVAKTSEIWPSADGSREFVFLHVAWGRFGAAGMFEVVNGIFHFLFSLPVAGNTQWSLSGPIWADGGKIVFLQPGPILIRFDEETKKTEVILHNGMELFGKQVVAFSTALNFEVNKLFICYSDLLGHGTNRLVALTGSGFEKIMTSDVDSQMPVWFVGKLAENRNIRVLPIMQEGNGKALHGFIDTLGFQFVSESDTRIRSLVEADDRILGQRVERLSDFVAVHGCDTEFATGKANGTVDRWYRFSFACIQQAATLVKSGEEVVLRGQNLSVAASLVDVVGTDDLGRETVITPGRVSPTEVAFLAPLVAESKAFKVKVRQNQGGGPVVSNAVTIQVNPLPVALPEVLGVVNGASFDLNQQLAPGTMFSLFGKNLGTAESSKGWSLPRKLGGTKVTICGVDAPLFANMGPMTSTDGRGQLWQINGVVPSMAALSSSCEVAVTVDQKAAAAVTVRGKPIRISSEPEETLAIFTFRGSYPNGAETQEAIVTNQLGQLIAPPGVSIAGTDPALFTQARACEVVSLWATGGGGTMPPVRDGEPAPSEPLAHMEKTPVVQIYAVDAQILFAGLAPGFAGFYQINVRVSCEATPGEQWLWFGRLPTLGKVYKIWIKE